MDETSVNLETVVSYDWMPTNTRTMLKTNNRDQKDCVIGGVSPKTGEELFIQTDKVDSNSVSLFIQKLSQNYPDYDNILILDNASYHVVQGTKKFPVPENIKLFYLPTYSPDFNPIERLWKYFKDKFINNRFFENIYQLRNTVNDALYNLLSDCNTVKSLCGTY
jgi:transposase